MHDGMSHLTPEATTLLNETDVRRIRAIKSRRWILYPRAKQALDRLGTLLDHRAAPGCPPSLSMVHDYLSATGAARGAFVYLTSGEITWIYRADAASDI